MIATDLPSFVNLGKWITSFLTSCVSLKLHYQLDKKRFTSTCVSMLLHLSLIGPWGKTYNKLAFIKIKIGFNKVEFGVYSERYKTLNYIILMFKED